MKKRGGVLSDMKNTFAERNGTMEEEMRVMSAEHNDKIVSDMENRFAELGEMTSNPSTQEFSDQVLDGD